jgi:hypothetical protein
MPMRRGHLGHRDTEADIASIGGGRDHRTGGACRQRATALLARGCHPQPKAQMAPSVSLEGVRRDDVWTPFQSLALAIKSAIESGMEELQPGAASGAADALFGDTAVVSVFPGSFANTLTTFAGNANQSVTVTDGALHAIQDVWDDANTLGAIHTDGSDTAQNGIGTANLGFSNTIFIGQNNSTSNPYDGTICEMGFDAISPNAP